MSFTKSLRQRRALARTSKAIARAIDGAATPTMRNELIAVAQRQFRSL